MPAEDMNRRKERVINEAKKVVDNINAMSFVNCDDQQVHSIMTMREIARGIVNNKVSKVTKSDVKKALSSSIEKMVGSCKDVNSILSRIPCDGMDDEQTHSVSRMKEIVLNIVSRRSKILGIRNRELLESDDILINAETFESKVAGSIITIDDDLDSGGVQRRLFEVEAEEPMMSIDDGQDLVMVEVAHPDNGSLPVAGEHEMIICDEVQVTPTEGLMFEGVELVLESELRNEDGFQDERQESANGISEQRSEVVQNEVKKLAVVSPFRICISWPRDGSITLDWVIDMMAKLNNFSKRDPPSEFSSLMSSDVLDKLIDAASSVLSEELNCVEVDCQGEDSRVIVVGDVEGQFHDLLSIFTIAGFPSENQFYVFNGNYVDRGAWGLEVFLVLLAWKILMPNRVYLLRGNHETKLCTTMYGFEQEVKTKFGEQGETVYERCLECFKELPLASIIAKTVYTTHGGLFRYIGPVPKSKRKRSQFLDLGSLEDLLRVKRSRVVSPDEGPNELTDILWSDPSKLDGLVENADKRLGLSWGPDCTESFLKDSNLKLIIRSHQGPDARVGQDDFGDLLKGYSEDHVVESGKLYTLFSAPDYPQFGEPKFNNEGAYAVLKAPNFENPTFHSFKGVKKPELAAYGASSSQTSLMSTEIDSEALGVSNLPSWSVLIPDNAGGSKAVEVPRAPAVEGMPLPSELQEPYKAALEYLFELISGLKHMISSRVIESGEHEPSAQGSMLNENEVEVTLNENGRESIPEENDVGQEIPDKMDMDEMEVDVLNENEGENVAEEKEAQDKKEEGENTSSATEERNVRADKEGERVVPDQKEGDIILAECVVPDKKGDVIPAESVVPVETEGEKEGTNVVDETGERPSETEVHDNPGENEGQKGEDTTSNDVIEKEDPNIQDEPNDPGEEARRKEEETCSNEKEEPKSKNEDGGEQKIAEQNEGKSDNDKDEEKAIVDENEKKEVDSENKEKKEADSKEKGKE